MASTLRYFGSDLVLCLHTFFPASARRGSLIVESEAVIDSETDPAVASDLTLALMELDQSPLTIANQTGIVGLSVNGTLCEWSLHIYL